MTALMELSGIRHHYGGREVLRVDKLAVAPGEILGLTGSNGAGKSTLLRIMALVERPSDGAVLLHGHGVNGHGDEARRQVTLLDQTPYLLKRSVWANVAYGLKARGAGDVDRRVRETLSLVGLDPAVFAKRWFRELSGGEARRVALAARLALRPALLLLDEPTASLDAESARRIQQAVAAERDQRGTALVIASHELAWLNQLADRTLHMEHGRFPD